MSDDWRRDQQAEFNRQLQGQMQAQLLGLQQQKKRKPDSSSEFVVAIKAEVEREAAAERRAQAEQSTAMARQRAFQEGWPQEGLPTKSDPIGLRVEVRNTPWQVSPLAEGTRPIPMAQISLSPLAQISQSQTLQEQLEEARTELRAERVASTEQESARMLMRDALNAGVSSGLFTEERALAIIALTGINDQPFPVQQARENIRLALSQALRAGAISKELVASVVMQIEVTPLDEVVGDQTEWYEEILYEALTIRPCHLPEHEEFHAVQTICSAHRGRISQDLLDALGLLPRMLPRLAHQDRQGQTLECCQDEAARCWLDTGLTDSSPEV